MVLSLRARQRSYVHCTVFGMFKMLDVLLMMTCKEAIKNLHLYALLWHPLVWQLIYCCYSPDSKTLKNKRTLERGIWIQFINPCLDWSLISFGWPGSRLGTNTPNPKNRQTKITLKSGGWGVFREIFHSKSPCWLTKYNLKTFHVPLKAWILC